MRNGLADSAGVIDPDIAHPWLDLAHIKKNNSHFVGSQLFGEFGVHFRGHNSDARSLILNHSSHCSPDAMRLIIGVTEKEVLAFFQGHGLKALDDFREEGIADVGNDQAKEIAMSPGQAPGVSVLVKSELLDGFEN